MKIIEEAEVRALISAGNASGSCGRRWRILRRGSTPCPLSALCHAQHRGVGLYAHGDFFGAKVLSAYGPNAGTGYPTHIGYVMLFECEHCSVAGLVDATAVTEIRTAL